MENYTVHTYLGYGFTAEANFNNTNDTYEKLNIDILKRQIT